MSSTLSFAFLALLGFLTILAFQSVKTDPGCPDGYVVEDVNTCAQSFGMKAGPILAVMTIGNAGFIGYQAIRARRIQKWMVTDPHRAYVEMKTDPFTPYNPTLPNRGESRIESPPQGRHIARGRPDKTSEKEG